MTNGEADEHLHAAIIEHAEAYGYADPTTEMLYEFALIAAWQPNVGNGTTVYSVHSHLTSCPSHILAGLFTMGLAFTTNDTHPRED